jgi:hypothetical protein
VENQGKTHKKQSGKSGKNTAKNKVENQGKKEWEIRENVTKNKVGN